MTQKDRKKTKISSPDCIKSLHNYFYKEVILKEEMYHHSLHRMDAAVKAMEEAVDYYHENYDVLSPKVLRNKRFLKKVLSYCKNDFDSAEKYVRVGFGGLIVLWKNNIELQELGFIPENNEFTFDTLSELKRMQIESVEFLEEEIDKKWI